LISFLTRDENDITDIKSIDRIGKSDHVVIVFGYLCECDNDSVTQVQYIYERGVSFVSELCSIDWENEFDGLDVNAMWIMFHDKFIQLVDRYVPIKSFYNKYSHPPWLTKSILHVIKSKDKLWIKYKITM